MYLADIKETFVDFPDNHSLAVIVFFEGCTHNCKGCQNPLLQTTSIKDYYSKDDVVKKIDTYCKRCNTDKIVLSGGDPYFNKHECMYVVDKLINLNYEVCVYTGYTVDKVEEFYEHYNYKKPTYLKCGTYREDLHVPEWGKTEEKLVLVSTNQAFYKLEGNEFKIVSEANVLRF